MSTFELHTCWEPTDVFEAIKSDAPAQELAVFLASHHPMECLARPFKEYGKRGHGQPVKDRDLVEALTGDLDPSGMLVMPVIGESGSGKSHLVRWVFENVPDRPDRKKVLIKKQHMSLRAVIEEILDGVPGQEFVEIREKLANARAEVDPELAQRHLLHRIVEDLEYQSRLQVDDGDRPDQHKRWILKNVPKLFESGEFKDKFVEDEEYQHYVNSVIEGNDTGDLRPFAFRPKHLHIENRDLEEVLGANAQRVVQHINTNRYLIDEVCEVLTNALPKAVQALIGIDRESLVDVMNQARAALKREGKHLVLAVEDATMLQGIDTELMQSLTTPDKTFCDVRIMIAVTTGFFSSSIFLMDTVESRARLIYDVDLLHENRKNSDDGGSNGIDRSEIVGLISRHLNAARLGSANIEQQFAAWEDAGHPRSEFSVRNKCDDCMHKEPCHTAFGFSDDEQEIGLYPFNVNSLDAVIEMAGNVFNPRAYVSTASDVLTKHAESIRAGSFPSKSLPNACPATSPRENLTASLDIHLKTRVFPDDKALQERGNILVRFWGGNPDHAIGLDLDEGVTQAFGLPKIPVGGKGDVHVPTPTPRDTEAEAPDYPDDYWGIDSHINDWREGGTGTVFLSSEDTVLKTALFNACLAYTDWDEVGYANTPWIHRVNGNPESSRYTSPEILQWQSITFGEPEKPGDLRGALEFWLSHDNDPSDAYVLTAINNWRVPPHDWAKDSGPMLLRTLSRKLDEWADQAKQLVSGNDSASYDRVLLEFLVVSAIACGQIDVSRLNYEKFRCSDPSNDGNGCGLCEACHSRHDECVAIVRKVMQKIEDQHFRGIDDREWDQFVAFAVGQGHSESRSKNPSWTREEVRLELISRTTSGGVTNNAANDPFAYDMAGLVPHIELIWSTDWQLTSSEDQWPQAHQQLVRDFRVLAERAARSRLQKWALWLGRMELEVGDDESLVEIGKKYLKLFGFMYSNARLPNDRIPDDVKKAVESFKDIPTYTDPSGKQWSLIQQVKFVLDVPDEDADYLQIALRMATVNDDHLTAVEKFFTEGRNDMAPHNPSSLRTMEAGQFDSEVNELRERLKRIKSGWESTDVV